MAGSKRSWNVNLASRGGKECLAVLELDSLASPGVAPPNCVVAELVTDYETGPELDATLRVVDETLALPAVHLAGADVETRLQAAIEAQVCVYSDEGFLIKLEGVETHPVIHGNGGLCRWLGILRHRTACDRVRGWSGYEGAGGLATRGPPGGVERITVPELQSHMEVSDVAQLFAYMADLRRRFLAKFREVGWEEVNRNREATHHSMRNIFVHMLDVEDSYLREAILGHSVEEADPEDFPSFDALEAYDREVAQRATEFFSSLEPDDLGRAVRVPWWRGRETSVEPVLLHAFLDEMAHLGELICLMWQMDVEPPLISIVRSWENARRVP